MDSGVEFGWALLVAGFVTGQNVQVALLGRGTGARYCVALQADDSVE